MEPTRSMPRVCRRRERSYFTLAFAVAGGKPDSNRCAKALIRSRTNANGHIRGVLLSISCWISEKNRAAPGVTRNAAPLVN